MNNGNQPKFKRKRYIVAPKFQFRYIGIILTLMFATAALCSYVVYYNSLVLMGEKLANVYPQGRLVAILKTVNVRVLVSVILVSPFVVILGIILSHRIAGPINRMERFLGNVASGDLTQKLTLRPKDELVPLANGINVLIDGLRANVVEKRVRMKNIFTELDVFKKELVSRSVDPVVVEETISKLEAELNSLSRELDKYKI